MIEIGLFWLGAAIVLAAILMLFFDVFQQNRLWAIAGLIFLIPLLVHVLLNWSVLNVRKALYALIIGVLTMLVSITGGALAHLPFLSDHEVVQVLEENIAPPKEEPLPNQEEANTASLSKQKGYDPLLTGSEYEDLKEKEIISEAKGSGTNVGSIPTSRYQSVSKEELSHAINKQVRITMNSGETVQGILTNASDKDVLVESIVEGGSMGLSYQYTQIESIEVLLHAGEQLLEVDEEGLEIESNIESAEQAVESESNIDQIVEDQAVEIDEAIGDKQLQPESTSVVEELLPETSQQLPQVQESIEETIIEEEVGIE